MIDDEAPSPSFKKLVWRHVCRPVGEAVLLYLFFTVTAQLSIASNTGGEVGELFDLTPHGLGMLCEAFAAIVLFTGFHVFYTLPALSVRRWPARTLRVVMYGLFVIFLTWLHWEQFVAVRVTADRVVLIRHYPRPPIEIPRGQLPQPELGKTGIVHVLDVRFGSSESVHSVAVYHIDSKTSETIMRLARLLGARERS